MIHVLMYVQKGMAIVAKTDQENTGSETETFKSGGGNHSLIWALLNEQETDKKTTVSSDRADRAMTVVVWNITDRKVYRIFFLLIQLIM